MISTGRGQRNYDPQNVPVENEKRFGPRYVRQHSWDVSTRFVPLPASRMGSPKMGFENTLVSSRDSSALHCGAGPLSLTPIGRKSLGSGNID
jgi:hypothetical protein